MTQRILTAGLIAGLLAGLLASALNYAALLPLILEAEIFEAAAGANGPSMDPTVPALLSETSGGRAWRNLSTAATTLVAFAGFGLLLGSCMALAASKGVPITTRTGALWGAAAFIAVHLAPAAALPPDLPGMEAAPLIARQTWWAFCVATTATALASLAFGRSIATIGLGIGLMALPYLIGAPAAPDSPSPVPPDLAAQFATRTLGVAVVVWVVLGTLCGWLVRWPRRQHV